MIAGLTDTRRHVVDNPEQMTADRGALRDLADAYAHAVDGRDPDAVAVLFTEEGRLVSRLHGGDEPIVRTGRREIAAALTAGLARYVVTTHIVGGQVVELSGDMATGTTVCLAHHVYERDGARRMLVMAVRYTDFYARQPDGWRFAQRELVLDWRQDRAMDG
jgi:uncharacterized protein (TIGR02246 family)